MRRLCVAFVLVAGCTASISPGGSEIEIGETIEYESSTEQGTIIERYLVERLVITGDEPRYEITTPSSATRWVAYQHRTTGSVVAILDASGDTRVSAAIDDGLTNLCVGGEPCQADVDNSEARSLHEDLTLLALELRDSPVVGFAALGVDDDVPYEWWEYAGWYSTFQYMGYYGHYWMQRETWHWWGVPMYYCIWYGDGAEGFYDNCQSAQT